MMNFYLTQSKKTSHSAQGEQISMHSYLVVEYVKKSLGQDFKEHKLTWESEDTVPTGSAPGKILDMPDGYRRFEISEEVYASLRLLAESKPSALHTLIPFYKNRTSQSFVEQQQEEARKEFQLHDVAKSLKQIFKDIMTV